MTKQKQTFKIERRDNEKINKELGVKAVYDKIIIYDKDGNRVYYENSEGYFELIRYSEKGRSFYSQRTDGFWIKRLYNTKGNEIFFMNGDNDWKINYWKMRYYDDKGNEIYFQDSTGAIINNRDNLDKVTNLEKIVAKDIDDCLKKLKIK